MLLFCLKCKKKTKTKGIVSHGNRVSGVCDLCGTKKRSFISTKGKGLEEALLKMGWNMGKIGVNTGLAAQSDFAKNFVKGKINEMVSQSVDRMADSFAKGRLNANKKIAGGAVGGCPGICFESCHGGRLSVHDVIGKLPRPKRGFVLPNMNYAGPFNPLEKQLEFDRQGNITKIMQQPTGKTDAVAMQHDVDYSVCSLDKSDADAEGRSFEKVACQNKADQKMLDALDSIPKNERQWGHSAARGAIWAKKSLGLGLQL